MSDTQINDKIKVGHCTVMLQAVARTAAASVQEGLTFMGQAAL